MRSKRVVAAIVEDHGRILVQRRRADGERAGLWEFPGGKREPGESDEVALARECQEELGIRVAVGPLVWETEHAYPDLCVSLGLFRCQLVDGAPGAAQAKEGQLVAWLRRDELSTVAFCEADAGAVAKLERGEI
ncbi:MAG: (deoxy)nucleoside triphosphate pyrophosphohydrolase [Deltaproteobacteria bacterium]